MATTTQKKRVLKYLNRDFESLKRDIIEHLRIYFPDTIQDFNESSVGMMLVELMAFTGDNLSFYLDRKFEESFLETAREKKNVFKHAKQLGFKAFGKSAAIGAVDAFLQVPASASDQGTLVPDVRFAGTIKRGAKLKSDSGEAFETVADIDFSNVDMSNPDLVKVSERDASSNEPISFALKFVGVDITAGESKTTTFAVGSYVPFRKLTISDKDVLEIISIVDSEGNSWIEVDFLAQDTVFNSVVNTGADVSEVPYQLKLKSVPFRFVSEFDINVSKTSLIFGTGDAQSFDGDLIPDLGDLSLPVFGKDTFTDFSLDPQNFLKTRTMGLAPTNTTLTVKYRIGGGASANAGANQISTVSDKVFDVGDTSLNVSAVKDVANSFSVLNSRPIQGGRDESSLEEIKQLVSATFASQSRMVTSSDFIARTLSLPSKFGSIFRANAKSNPINKNSVELIILSRDTNGNVSVAPGDLKKNLKRYLSRFRMLTDSIEILDGEIINIAIDFSVLVDEDFNKNEVVGNCMESLKDFFEIDKWQINQPVNRTTIFSLLSSVPGVVSVIDFNVFNRIGTFDGRPYSSDAFNIKKNTKNGIIYCEENAIFELKFPQKDIVGVAK